jgi:hypothetical protein
MEALQFPQIRKLEELETHLFSLPEGEKGVLALDFDHVLVRGTGIGEEGVYKWLLDQNSKAGLYKYGHYSWTAEVRKTTPYIPCEDPLVVNRVVIAFKDKGWDVVILTSRGVDMQECTEYHLKTANLPFLVQDVIFKERNSEGKLLKKNESFAKWVDGHSTLSKAKKVHVLFTDDSISYCEEVQALSSEVNRFSAKCFHYIGALPDSKLSQEKIERLFIQLHAYRNKETFSDDSAISVQDLLSAKEGFKVEEVNSQTLYECMKDVARIDGKPFTE